MSRYSDSIYTKMNRPVSYVIFMYLRCVQWLFLVIVFGVSEFFRTHPAVCAPESEQNLGAFIRWRVVCFGEDGAHQGRVFVPETKLVASHTCRLFLWRWKPDGVPNLDCRHDHFFRLISCRWPSLHCPVRYLSLNERLAIAKLSCVWKLTDCSRREDVCPSVIFRLNTWYLYFASQVPFFHRVN